MPKISTVTPTINQHTYIHTYIHTYSKVHMHGRKWGGKTICGELSFKTLITWEERVEVLEPVRSLDSARKETAEGCDQRCEQPIPQTLKQTNREIIKYTQQAQYTILNRFEYGLRA
jgi:hypothetical protein